MYTELNMKNWNQLVIESDKVTLVDVWAPWCVPCRQLAPILEKIANEHTEYNICKLNADDNSILVTSLGVKNIPTCILFKNGKIIEKIVGLQTEEFFLDKLSNI